MQTRPADSRIKRDVLDELRWDTRVDEADVGVEVDQGVVTLTGTVDSWAKRVAAEEAAHRVAAVRDVANNVQIRSPSRRTDAELALAVRQALEWNVMVPDDEIQTTVSNGAVTLTGTVDYFSQRADAEAAIERLDGVRFVSNRLEVRDPQLTPNAVRRAIEAALDRRADLTASELQIDVRDGAVTVTGTVSCRGERDAVIGAASALPGVKRVDDRLRLAS